MRVDSVVAVDHRRPTFSGPSCSPRSARSPLRTLADFPVGTRLCIRSRHGRKEGNKDKRETQIKRNRARARPLATAHSTSIGHKAPIHHLTRPGPRASSTQGRAPAGSSVAKSRRDRTRPTGRISPWAETCTRRKVRPILRHAHPPTRPPRVPAWERGGNLSLRIMLTTDPTPAPCPSRPTRSRPAYDPLACCHATQRSGARQVAFSRTRRTGGGTRSWRQSALQRWPRSFSRRAPAWRSAMRAQTTGFRASGLHPSRSRSPRASEGGCR